MAVIKTVKLQVIDDNTVQDATEKVVHDPRNRAGFNSRNSTFNARSSVIIWTPGPCSWSRGTQGEGVPPFNNCPSLQLLPNTNPRPKLISLKSTLLPAGTHPTSLVMVGPLFPCAHLSRKDCDSFSFLSCPLF